MSYNIDERLIEAQFFESLQKAGIKPREEFNPIMDGQLHRFSTEGDKYGATSGAYIIYADNWPHWYIKDFRITANKMLHFSFDKEALSREDRRAIYQELNNPINQAAMKARQEQNQLHQKENEAQALRQAITEYETAFFFGVSKHPYIYQRFIKKNLHIPLSYQAWDFEYFLGTNKPYNALKVVHNPIDGAFAKKGDLMIPLTNVITRQIQTFQLISSSPNQEGKYQKGFYRGLSPKFCCIELIPENSMQQNILYLCEGYSTSLSILILTEGKFPVFASLSASNLINVALGLRERFKGKKIYLMADNDKATELKIGHNPGIEAAEKVLREGFCNKVIPAEIKGTNNQNIDWYDVLEKGITEHE